MTWGINGKKILKGQTGPLSKQAWVVPCHNLCIESPKSARCFGNPMFEGEVDVFPRENVNKIHVRSSPNIKLNSTKAQSQCVRLTHMGKSVHTNHSFGSSGWNLACEGLLLGVWIKDHRETPHKTAPCTKNLHHYCDHKYPHLFCRDR
jgi:hypothetical protein